MADSIVSKAKVIQELERLKNWLGRKSDKDSVQHIIDRIDVLAGIDAVQVERCRDCEYWSGRKDKPGEATAIGYCDHPNHHIMPLNANWYCADGVKRNGGPT